MIPEVFLISKLKHLDLAEFVKGRIYVEGTFLLGQKSTWEVKKIFYNSAVQHFWTLVNKPLPQYKVPMGEDFHSNYFLRQLSGLVYDSAKSQTR